MEMVQYLKKCTSITYVMESMQEKIAKSFEDELQGSNGQRLSTLSRLKHANGSMDFIPWKQTQLIQALAIAV